MLSSKQGNYWYHFYNVFGMTRSFTGDWTLGHPALEASTLPLGYRGGVRVLLIVKVLMMAMVSLVPKIFKPQYWTKLNPLYCLQLSYLLACFIHIQSSLGICHWPWPFFRCPWHSCSCNGHFDVGQNLKGKSLSLRVISFCWEKTWCFHSLSCNISFLIIIHAML